MGQMSSEVSSVFEQKRHVLSPSTSETRVADASVGVIACVTGFKVETPTGFESGISWHDADQLVAKDLAGIVLPEVAGRRRQHEPMIRILDRGVDWQRVQLDAEEGAVASLW
jgi:hypothetical protein